MARDVRWKMRFQSLKGINYELDIYDNYTGTKPASWPLTLLPGETPFTTSEDNSDDFFEPVRHSSGTIQVLDEDGTMLEQLMPATNTDRYVQLVRKGATSADDYVAWQGFLSCDVYQQVYTAVAQCLEINVNSVLETMDSVRIKESDLSGFVKIYDLMQLTLSGMVNYGATFNRIYIPVTSYRIFNQYINPSLFVEKKEQYNGSSPVYIENGTSYKEILATICRFMGWCVRESKDDIYFMPITHNTNDDERYLYKAYTDPVFRPQSQYMVSVQDLNISSLEWRGNEHNKSFKQGARSVEVVGSLKQFPKSGMSLPEFPGGSSQYLNFYIWDNAQEYDYKYVHLLLSKLPSTYTNFSFLYYKCSGVTNYPRGSVSSYEGMSDINGFVGGIFSYNELCSYDYTEPQTIVNVYTGATYARMEINTSSSQPYVLGDEGIYLQFMPILPTTPWRHGFQPIFNMRSTTRLTYTNGYFYLKASCKAFFMHSHESVGEDIATDIILRSSPQDYSHEFEVMFKVGTQQSGSSNYKYWNGSAWTTSSSTFKMSLNGSGFNSNYGGNDYRIPTDGIMNGFVEFSIYPKTDAKEYGSGGFDADVLESIFFNSLSVDFGYKDELGATDRSENHYFRLLNLNFSEEVSVSNDIATDQNNKMSPSLIFTNNDGTSKLTEMEYELVNENSEYRRPEEDLLSRLAKYYGKVRRKLELITEKPLTVLPMLRIDARNNAAGQVNAGYDGKLYLPLAESRDWQQDTSTITCFETPDGDE